MEGRENESEDESGERGERFGLEMRKGGERMNPREFKELRHIWECVISWLEVISCINI